MASLKKRGTQWYAQYYLGRTQKRISLQTTSYGIANEKLRRLESGLAQGDDNPLPSSPTARDHRHILGSLIPARIPICVDCHLKTGPDFRHPATPRSASGVSERLRTRRRTGVRSMQRRPAIASRSAMR